MRIDLHIHSAYSDHGVLDPGEIVAIARKRGLDGVAITDHNTIRGGLEAKEYETGGFAVIVGAEIETERGEIAGLFLTTDIESFAFHDVILEIREQGGLVVVPHPFDALRRSAFAITDEDAHLVDAIEGFNSRCVFQKYNAQAQEFAARHNLPAVGGSDAHYGNEIGLGGIVTKSDDVRAAIVSGDFCLFGRRSSIWNHVRTKIRKAWTKS